MRYLLTSGLCVLLFTGALSAQPQQPGTYQQSSSEQDMRDVENALRIGRRALPLYRKILIFQRQNLTSVPGRDGNVYDYSNGTQGLNAFSREINARARGAAAGSEEDVLWLEQFLLPTAERAIESGVIRDLLELGDYADQLERGLLDGGRRRGSAAGLNCPGGTPCRTCGKDNRAVARSRGARLLQSRSFWLFRRRCKPRQTSRGSSD